MRTRWVFLFLISVVGILGQTPCWELNCGVDFQRPTPIPVTIGGFFNSISSFDVQSTTVRFDTFMWIKWPVCVRDKNNQTFNPHLTLELQNAAARVDVTIKPTFPSPVCNLFPGFAYWELRIEGLFQQSLNFIKFPLDSHDLVISIEDTTFARNNLLYQLDKNRVNDLPASGFKNSLALSGWQVESFVEKEAPSSYDTADFFVAYNDIEFSNYKFGLRVSRGSSVYFLKVLPPIVITLIISLIVLLLDIEATDSRVATAVGGLLAEIFLQLSFTGDLPQSADYLSLIDWVFNICYVAIMVVIIECVVVRKIYYQLLLESQKVKDDIQMANLHSDASAKDLAPPTLPYPYNGESTKGSVNMNISHIQIDSKADLLEIANRNRRKKEKVKRRIRRIERILFFAFIIACFLFIGIATLAIRFGN